MPCYYDSPDSSDQEEIERRSKERMYFEAQTLLDEGQMKKAIETDLKKFPANAEHLNESLCKICKILTDEQMKSISAYYWNIEWNHKSLYDWHVKHCEDDLKLMVNNEQ